MAHPVPADGAARLPPSGQENRFRWWLELW